MSAFPTDILVDIARLISISRFDEVTPLLDKPIAGDVTRKFVLGAGSAKWILIVSSPLSPLLVQRAVDRQRLARSLLEGIASEAIELPLTSGFDGELSYAVWPMRRPLSSNRIAFNIDKFRLLPRIYWWIRELAVQTVGPADSNRLALNSERLCNIRQMALEVKREADRAVEAFASGKASAIQVLQHGDLWIGNILKSPAITKFVVIDWPGARLDGAPFFDLVKFGLSVGVSKTTLRKEIEAHSAVLLCRPQDASFYVLSGLGQLYSEIEHFPENEFIQLCRRKLDILKSLQ